MGKKKEISTTEIASRLNEFIINERFSDRAAFFTHYYHANDQTVRDYYHEGALDYIEEVANYLSPGLEITRDFMDSVIEDYSPEYLLNRPIPVNEEAAFSFIDLFAGIGGFRIALQGQNGSCVFSSEWDRFSKKTYFHNYGEIPFGDITKIDENNIPDHDILAAGFPCQPFSLAGVSKKTV